MNYSAKIEVNENIVDLFESENKEFTNNRASYKLKKTKNGVLFEISAKDATALRAILNSIAKNLIVYEKVKNGKRN